MSVRAFGSTDVGVSFLLQAGGKKIFHAGDLNNWHWMDESTEAEWKGAEKNFLHELDDLYAYTPEVDVAMFPVDPRLGKEYMRGAGQFVTKIKLISLYPCISHRSMPRQMLSATLPKRMECVLCH